MRVPAYLQRALNECNPEVRAQLILEIARSQNRSLNFYQLWLHLESGITCGFVLMTLSVLLFSSINATTTGWFQSLKLFNATIAPTPSVPASSSTFRSAPISSSTFRPEQGRRLKVGDKVASYLITSGFGFRTHPVYGSQGFHNGVDLGTPTGTKIVAPFDGEVEQVSNDRCGYGLRFYSPRMPRNRIGMCHLSSRVASGKVKAGQQIALSGGAPGTKGAGASTGEHWHFALFDKDGNPVHPTNTVVQKFLAK